MSRYRKIDIRMWSDEEFRKLSKPAANGQSLFQYCLTGPFTTNIPGLFSAGEAAMAERLGWPLKSFRESFRELSRKPLVKADWQAKLVFIPNAIRYNIPHNPNVVKSWADTWDELPECPLKVEAYHHLRSFLQSLNESYSKSFAEDCRNHLPDHSPIQDQDQDQDQEKDTPAAIDKEFDEFWKDYPPRNGKRVGKPEALARFRQVKPEDRSLVLTAVRNYASSELIQKGIGIKDPHRWLRNGKKSEPWRDWIEPERPTIKESQNGKPQLPRTGFEKRDYREGVF